MSTLPFACCRCNRRRTGGFTLIELLVVIAIIALLVSILLPSLNRAKELAKGTICLSNCKSLGTAFHIYAQDYKQFVPPDRMAPNESWVTGHANWGLPTWDANLYEAHESAGLYGCPSDTVSHRIGDGGWGEFTLRDGTNITQGYRSFSILVNGWTSGSYPLSPYGVAGCNESRSLDRIAGSDTVLLGEVHTSSQIMGHYSYSGLVFPTQLPGWSTTDLEVDPGMYHGGRQNWVVMDGHAEQEYVMNTIGTGTPTAPRGWWSIQAGD